MSFGVNPLLTRPRRTTDSRHKMGMVVINNILNALKGEALTNQVRMGDASGARTTADMLLQVPEQKKLISEGK